MEAYFLGIDIGTQGARAVLVDSGGMLINEQSKAFYLSNTSREEQSPGEWWDACLQIMKKLLVSVPAHIDLDKLKAIAVTSTSGTMIPLDQQSRPLHNALMYSDKRAAEVAPLCKEVALQYFGSRPAYTGFNASSGLCKMVWYVKHFPEKNTRIAKWAHAADFITGKLSGRFGISDETNALKSGYDIFSGTWPDYLYQKLPLKKNWLPNVVPAGTPVGSLTAELTEELGLKRPVKVVAGMTDGCASQIASGAVRVGDWNTTIGTTMVIKGVTKEPLIDPEGRLYNHKHPGGLYMPGGAGNTGADWISLGFKEDLAVLSQEAGKYVPSGFISWPLRTDGERFPIIAPQARGFEPEGLSRQQRFVANMEGVAYLERYAYEMIEGLSGETVQAIYTAGGGSKSDIWLKIRSNVLNLPIYKMKYVSGAVGAAILAASKTHFDSLQEAVEALTQRETVVCPEQSLADNYNEYYNQFVRKLKEKKYIS